MVGSLTEKRRTWIPDQVRDDGKEKNLDPGSVIPAEAGTGVTEKRSAGLEPVLEYVAE